VLLFPMLSLCYYYVQTLRSSLSSGKRILIKFAFVKKKKISINYLTFFTNMNSWCELLTKFNFL
jgi:hypothetical protein